MGQMKASEPSRIMVVGYGTLLYRASLGDTIGKSAASEREMVPVLVSGFRRLFNLRPDHYGTSNLCGKVGVENAAMNVEPVEGAILNGLAFWVEPSEIAKLDERERYYDRLEIEALDFETGDSLGTGHIYGSKPKSRWIERDPEKLLPLWRDVLWARAGSYAVGRRFGETFDRTTYLADGETLVAHHYIDHLTPGQPPGPEELLSNG